MAVVKPLYEDIFTQKIKITRSNIVFTKLIKDIYNMKI